MNPFPSALWTASHSIVQEQFEPRPIREEISIVIPTLGRDILEECLYWIFHGSVWPGCLIVVNQGPNEKAEVWINHLRTFGIYIKHIESQQRGRSAGVNRGLEQVETQFVAITDDDCFVDVHWLQNMAAQIEKHPDGVTTGRVEAAGEDMLLVVTSNTPSVYRKPRIKFDSMSGGNMGTSMVVIQEVGLFDEDPCLRTAEDAEWSYRALRKNIPIFYHPDICVWHFGWRDPEKRKEQYRHYALSQGGFYGKYLRKGDLFILLRLSMHYFRSLRRWFFGRLKGDEELALIGRAYFLNLLPGIVAGILSRRPVEQLARSELATK